MRPRNPDFYRDTAAALHNKNLQQALTRLKPGFINKRAKAKAHLPEFEALRDRAKEIKDHTLTHLDFYLEQFEAQVMAQGGQVHWARDAAEAQRIIIDICKKSKAHLVTKGKSMVTEEIGLNKVLEQAGLCVLETDLGEYIIQLRRETPSHIIAPAIHVLKQQVAESFRQNHRGLPENRPLDLPEELIQEARKVLRTRFGQAQVGITGANLLIAETGQAVIVTNEGNGDLTQTLAKTHVVVASLEKVVPTLEEASVILRILARSATGQEISTYTTFSTGPRRPGDPDGPEQFHVLLLDNGRSEMLSGAMRPMLRCIRCGACMNHCPVYGAVGGHAYGWVYPGPMGAVLTPAFAGLRNFVHLPHASSFCGRCAEVCPMRIPLPDLMRQHRQQAHATGLTSRRGRLALALWAFAARHPRLYQRGTGLMVGLLSLLGRKRGRLQTLPLIGEWTKDRDFPTPQGRTFQQMWQQRRGQHD